jgi:thymidylate synthase (FAD)
MKPIVKLIQVTPNSEEHIAYCARVSNPKNQENNSFEGLIKYCIQHQHWSIFEHAFMTIEINTSLAIATQILRHRSFTFQQFSQRYADANLITEEIPIPELRRQDSKNRQNSIDDLDEEVVFAMNKMIRDLFRDAQDAYSFLLEQGVAKECARFVLPQATPTRLYMTGSVRSWIHYILLREKNGTQKEHMEIAKLCKNLFSTEFPTIASALSWA